LGRELLSSHVGWGLIRWAARRLSLIHHHQRP
jgi:hypothetical protein